MERNSSCSTFFLPFGNDVHFLLLLLLLALILFLFGAKQPPQLSSILLLSGKELTPLQRRRVLFSLCGNHFLFCFVIFSPLTAAVVVHQMKDMALMKYKYTNYKLAPPAPPLH